MASRAWRIDLNVITGGESATAARWPRGFPCSNAQPSRPLPLSVVCWSLLRTATARMHWRMYEVLRSVAWHVPLRTLSSIGPTTPGKKCKRIKAVATDQKGVLLKRGKPRCLCMPLADGRSRGHAGNGWSRFTDQLWEGEAGASFFYSSVRSEHMIGASCAGGLRGHLSAREGERRRGAVCSVRAAKRSLV
jgi:hypothetical protein